VKAYVFDTNAIVTYFDNREGSDRLESIIASAESRTASVYMSAINVGEVFYVIWRRKGETEARRRIQQLVSSPIMIVPAQLAEVLHAAELKAKYRCGYADAFAAALAISKRATLVTADPDLRRFSDKLKILWLPGHKSVN
jgi:predicted nucleic acid-binding protein